MKAWTIRCAADGCARTVPALRADLVFTCPEHSGPAIWPLPDAPCSDAADCGMTCQRDDHGFVHDALFGGGDEPEQDVQVWCMCPHHVTAWS